MSNVHYLRLPTLQRVVKPDPKRPRNKARLELLKAHRERFVLMLLKQLEVNNHAWLFLREHAFHPQRKWRFDLYVPAYKLAVEIHGGIYTQGRHTRGQGFRVDRQKMNAAVELGIRVLEYTAAELADGSAAAQIARVLAQARM